MGLLAAQLAGAVRDWAAAEPLVAASAPGKAEAVLRMDGFTPGPKAPPAVPYAAARALETWCGRLDRLRRRWSLQLSAAISSTAHTLLRPYLSESPGRRFRDGEEPEAPMIDLSPQDQSAEEPSPLLDGPGHWLVGVMRVTAAGLDGRSHAEVWRAVGQYINR